MKIYDDVLFRLQTIKAEEVFEKAGIGWPHTSHCLANGQIMISGMGDKDGNAKGNAIWFLLYIPNEQKK